MRPNGRRLAPAPVILIAGPTASGKSALALELAVAYDGRDHQRRQPADLSRFAHPVGPPRCHGRWRGRHTGFTAISTPPSAARPAAGGPWRSLRSPPAIAPAGCRSSSAALGFICVRCSDGLASIPPIPAAIREEAVALFRTLGDAAFRERLAALDPVAAARLSPGDRQRLMRAWEVVRATGRPLGAWQASAAPASPYRFASVLLAAAARGALRRLRCALSWHDRGGRARRGGSAWPPRPRP